MFLSAISSSSYIHNKVFLNTTYCCLEQLSRFLLSTIHFETCLITYMFLSSPHVSFPTYVSTYHCRHYSSVIKHIYYFFVHIFPCLMLLGTKYSPLYISFETCQALFISLVLGLKNHNYVWKTVKSPLVIVINKIW